MIEYLHDAIRAVSNEDIDINAYIVENDGSPITDNCVLVLHNKDKDYIIGEYPGTYIEDYEMWSFTVPSAATLGLKGRYWYSIRHKDNNMNFLQPIYLV